MLSCDVETVGRDKAHTKSQSKPTYIITRPSEEIALTLVCVYLPDFNSFVFPTLFPMHAPEAFDGITTWLDDFLFRCVLYKDFVLEPKPTGWAWV